MSNCTNPNLGKLIHAYEVDTLPEEDLERFEIHLLSCKHCFKEIQQFENYAAILRQDEDVKILVREASRGPLREPGSFWESLWRYLWPEAPLVMKPALAYLLVLALLIPAYHGIQGEKKVDPIIHPVPIISCFPLRDAGERVFNRSTSDEGMISFYYMRSTPGKPYQVIIQAEDGTTVFQDDQYDRFDEHGTGWLLLPLKTLTPGRYRLSIADTDSEPPHGQEYDFLIEH